MSRDMKKLRKKADETLRLAEKIDNYRNDILAPAQVERLRAEYTALAAARRDRNAEPAALRDGIQRLESVMAETGGSFYERRSLTDNVEMLLMIAIFAIGVRTFFFQPFKIPTNSMYPTYNGMTHEVFQEGETPGALASALRFVAWGSVNYSLDAAATGRVLIPVGMDSAGNFHAVPSPVAGRKWLLFPTTKARFTFYTGARWINRGDSIELVSGTPVHVDVPWEFASQFSKILRDRFGSETEGRITPIRIQGQERTGLAFIPEEEFESGETFLSFAILTGDQLIVDRISYHFVRPNPGAPFVFRTDKIPAIGQGNEGKYYIKRIAGVPGDQLAIEPPGLLRNGEPADAARAFVLNAEQAGEYEGYTTGEPGMSYLRRPGAELGVPDNSYVALGDNSDESQDSRYWGFVPEESIIGRAVFIYYPFTKRWGPAR